MFFVNVPIGIAVAVLALRYVPRDPPHPDNIHFPDGSGRHGAPRCRTARRHVHYQLRGEMDAVAWLPAFAASLVIAVAAAWMFFRHVGRSPHPFIAPRLIRGPGFGPVNLVNAIFGGVTLGAVALIPLYAANRYGMNALDSGTLLIAQGIAAIALSIIGAFALRRTGYRMPLYVGGAVVAIGLLLLAFRPIPAVPTYQRSSFSTLRAAPVEVRPAIAPATGSRGPLHSSPFPSRAPAR